MKFWKTYLTKKYVIISSTSFSLGRFQPKKHSATYHIYGGHRVWHAYKPTALFLVDFNQNRISLASLKKKNIPVKNFANVHAA
jgi:hypothetical protein